MRTSKVMIGALLVALAAVGLAATSAFALNGEFIEPGGGRVLGAIGVTQKTALVLETLAKVKITCETASGKAETTGTMNAISGGIIFKKCVKSTGGTCKTKGEAETIKAGKLNLEVVRFPGLAQDLILTELAEAVEFECAEVKVLVKSGGRFLSEVAPVGVPPAAEFTLTAKCATPGMPELTKYVELAGVETTIAETEGLQVKVGAGAFEGVCVSGEVAAKLTPPAVGEFV